jgi:hypothetical protein
MPQELKAERQARSATFSTCVRPIIRILTYPQGLHEVVDATAGKT